MNRKTRGHRARKTLSLRSVLEAQTDILYPSGSNVIGHSLLAALLIPSKWHGNRAIVIGVCKMFVKILTLNISDFPAHPPAQAAVQEHQ